MSVCYVRLVCCFTVNSTICDSFSIKLFTKHEKYGSSIVQSSRFVFLCEQWRSVGGRRPGLPPFGPGVHSFFQKWYLRNNHWPSPNKSPPPILLSPYATVCQDCMQCCSCLFVSSRTVVYRSHYKRPQFPPRVDFGGPNYRLHASHVASHVDLPSRTLLTVRPARLDGVLLRRMTTTALTVCKE